MKIVPVLRQAMLKDIDEDFENLEYWLSKSPGERVSAVTKLVKLSLKPGERLDRTKVSQQMLHP